MKANVCESVDMWIDEQIESLKLELEKLSDRKEHFSSMALGDVGVSDAISHREEVLDWLKKLKEVK